jgi:Fe2+ transport system protein FeoA
MADDEESPPLPHLQCLENVNRSAIPLDRFKPGMAGTIARIEPEEGDLLRYLAVLGLIPQARLEVAEVAPFGGPVLIRVGRAEYALGRDVASKIFVKET